MPNFYDGLRWLNTLGEVGALFKTIQAMGEMEKNYPVAFEIHTKLKEAKAKTDIAYDEVGADGRVAIRSKNYIKGVFNSFEFESIALVRPEDLVTTFMYMPEYAIFVYDNSNALILQNWINKQLTIGRFMPTGEPYRNNVGKMVQQFSYVIEIPCENIPLELLVNIFSFGFENLLQFREIYMHLIDGVSNVKLSIDILGELSGKDAYEVSKNINAAHSKFSFHHPDPQKIDLLDYLVKTLREAGYSITSVNGGYYLIESDKDSPWQIQSYFYVNRMYQIVMQSYSSRIDYQYSSHHLLQQLNFGFENYYFDSEEERIVFRNSLDWRNFNIMPPKDIILDLLHAHHQANTLHFPALQIAIKNNLTIDEAIMNMVSGSNIVEPKMSIEILDSEGEKEFIDTDNQKLPIHEESIAPSSYEEGTSLEKDEINQSMTLISDTSESTRKSNKTKKKRKVGKTLLIILGISFLCICSFIFSILSS